MPTEFEIIENIKINTNDRISIFGKTGSGKTELAKSWLLPHYDSYVFWDIKHENNDADYEMITIDPKELKEDIKKYNKILYQPQTTEQSDFDEVCKIIFEHKNTTLYVDEASAISNPGSVSYWHKIIMTQGRSYGVGIINSSQRPRMIHNTLISENEHMFIFALNLETDIIKLRQQIGDATDEIGFLKEHNFLYHSVKTGKSFLFEPIKKIETIEFDEKGHPKIPKLELYRPTIEEYISISI